MALLGTCHSGIIFCTWQIRKQRDWEQCHQERITGMSSRCQEIWGAPHPWCHIQVSAESFLSKSEIEFPKLLKPVPNGLQSTCLGLAWCVCVCVQSICLLGKAAFLVSPSLTGCSRVASPPLLSSIETDLRRG